MNQSGNRRRCPDWPRYMAHGAHLQHERYGPRGVERERPLFSPTHAGGDALTPPGAAESPPGPPRPFRPPWTAPRGRVLVIDNEPAILLVVHRILGPDYELSDATLAADAVALIAGGTRFDAILCDLLMPGLSGQDFYRQLLSVDPLVAYRVIFMTGAATLPDVRHFLSSTGNEVLEKPFTRAALQAAVQSMCTGTR